MARVLISGYYGFNNAGDDTVLYGIITSLKKQAPDIELAVLSNTPEETRELFGIPSFNRWSLKEIIREMRKSDLLIMGGGSLLQDATSPRSVIYYLGIVRLAKLLGKPVVFFAQGVGPIRHRLSKRLIKWIVNKVDIITVRDHQSGRDLTSFGVKKVPIHITADPAVTIRPEQISHQNGKQILMDLGIDFTKPSVAISVRDWKNERQFKLEVAKMADELIEKGWNVIFLPLHYPADVSSSKDIIHKMNHPSAFLISGKINFKEIISILGYMNLVIGMRLHSVILSSVMNVPFIGISYDPKIDRYVERLEMKSAGHIQSLKYEDLSQQVHFIISNIEETKETLMRNMEKVIKAAEKSSRLALEILYPNQES